MSCSSELIGEYRVCFSRHALTRALDLGIPGATLREVISNPTWVWISPRYNCPNLRLGSVTVALDKCRDDPTHWVVKTVLPSKREDWERAQKDGRLTADRQFDPERFKRDRY